MEVKPGYKQTEAGVIPEDWSLRPLGSIGKWFSGGTPSMSNAAYWVGDMPWVSPKDMKVSRLHDSIDHITEKAVAAGARLVPAGAILVVIRGMILAHSFPVARAERTLAFNQDIKAVVTGDGVGSQFLLYWFAANTQQLLGITTESTHGTKRLPTEMLFRELVACPPTSEQEVIAEALSDADFLIESLEQLLAKKRQLKQGAMQELLTGKKRLPGFESRPGHKQTEVGVIPEDWEVKSIAQIAPLQRGFDLPTSQLKDGPYPVVYSNGVMTFHHRAMARGPGVITGRSGTLGKVHYVETDYWPHNTSLWVTRFNGNDERFVYYLYCAIGFERFASGSGVPTLNRNDAHAFFTALPATKAEQTAIAAILSDMDAEIAALEARVTKALSLKQGMMQELLTGRIRLV